MFEKGLLKGKRILVTGGGSGLGAAMGRRFLELGADLIKTDYAGDSASMRSVVEECPIPILVLGGSRYSSDAEAFALIHGAVAAGAAGVFFGRNVFQADDMLAFLQNARAALNETEVSPAGR